jgi:GTPase
MFADEVRIHVKAGDGGAGSASIRREPYKPRGGPEGGDGGRGGDVALRVDPSLFDLSPYADSPHHRAKAGGPGGKNNRHGADGPDLFLPVPEGTLVHDDGGLIADLVGPETSVVVARGGRGGRGSAALAGPRNRVPRVAEQGEPGEEGWFRLELRLVADVALVGAPNAGKSTLLSGLTAARPRIAPYPFTTVSPNVGVAEADDRRFVIADVPGLIEGAHGGKGLGLDFLRHVARARVLVYVVDLAGDPLADLKTVREEVAAFDPDLGTRRSLVVGTKSDLLGDGFAAPSEVHMVVSGVTGEGVDELSAEVGRLVERARSEEPPSEGYVVIRPARESFAVRREGRRFHVSGPRVERWVAETDLDDARGVAELQRRLVRAGVERRLAEAGARRGDEVIIGGTAFEFIPEEDLKGSRPAEGSRKQGRGDGHQA